MCLMCSANVRLELIRTPRHWTLHSEAVRWSFSWISAVFIFVSVTCWGEPVQLNCVLSTFSSSRFDIIQLSSYSIHNVRDFNAVMHSQTCSECILEYRQHMSRSWCSYAVQFECSVVGPRTLPWGTPRITADSADFSLAKLTVCTQPVPKTLSI